MREQGYIFSQNSAKGANGKLQGTVVVKVLPGNLDRFLLQLRLLGDMKNQTVSAQDVTKDYTDTQAHIRNSEITEQRLIDMLKTRTGKVSDLLEVEDEIAKVRGEIEEMEGQLRVYDAQVQFATVTITLQEKDINQAAAYLLQEHAQLSLFAKDVEKAFADAKGDAADAKAQTLESHIERDAPATWSPRCTCSSRPTPPTRRSRSSRTSGASSISIRRRSGSRATARRIPTPRRWTATRWS